MSGVGVTGVAGPGGGSRGEARRARLAERRRAEGAALTRSVNLPGGRADVRDRATTVAMHLIAAAAGRCGRAAERAERSRRRCPRAPRRACSWRSIRRRRCCERLAAWARIGACGALGLRWRLVGVGARARRELLHVTLCFLGERPVEEIEAIAAALERVRDGGRASCRSARRCGCRRGARGRWRWRSATTAQRRVWRRCSEALGEALAQASGFREERRRFRAHVTLARCAAIAVGSSLARARALPADAGAVVHARRRSSCTARGWRPAGASYEALASARSLRR